MIASRDYISVSVSKLEFGFIQLIRIERSNFSRISESYVSIPSFIFSRCIVAIQETSKCAGVVCLPDTFLDKIALWNKTDNNESPLPPPFGYFMIFNSSFRTGEHFQLQGATPVCNIVT